jgi:hypothetical protein
MTSQEYRYPRLPETAKSSTTPTNSTPPRGLLNRIEQFVIRLDRKINRIDAFIQDFREDIADTWHQRPLRPRRPTLNDRYAPRVYESSTEVFESSFPQATTRYIMVALAVEVMHPRRWRRRHAWRYPVMYRYYRSNGSLLVELHEEWVIQDSWNIYERWRGYGWEEPGQWTPDEYRLEIWIDGEKVTTLRFTLEPPPVRRPLTADLHQPRVSFFVPGTGDSQREESWELVRFPQKTTREVICKLTVRNLLPQDHNQTYPVRAQCYTPDEKLLWECQHDWVIKGEEEASISWGWSPPGQWDTGAYRVDILIDGADFAWGAFLIEDSP